MYPVSFYLFLFELLRGLLSCRSEGSGCRTWSRADNKKLSTIVLSWVIFCVGKFIRATVKAAFLFFLSLPFSLKRERESVAYFLEKPLVKSEKVR